LAGGSPDVAVKLTMQSLGCKLSELTSLLSGNSSFYNATQGLGGLDELVHPIATPS
jgi:hypothetical protein